MTNSYPPPPPAYRWHNVGIALFTGLLAVSPCAAQMSKEDAFEAGKQAGRDSTPDYDQMFSEQNTQTVVPHEQGSEEHSKFWADTGSKITDMVVEGVNLLATCMGGAEGPGDQLRCEAVRMLMGASQKKGVKEELVKEDDPMFQIRDAMMKNPEAMAGAWGGEYTDCQEFSLGGGTEFDYETCTEVASVAGEDEEYCTLGRTVVIDPDRLYQCTRTMSQMNSGQCVFGERVTIDTNTLYDCDKKPENRETLLCEKVRVVMIRDSEEPPIKPESIQADMESSFTAMGSGQYKLTFGRPGDNYLGGDDYQAGGPPHIYDRTMTFTINNLSAIAVFTAFSLNYDDWLQINVNGTQVFNGPKGGDRLEFGEQCLWVSNIKNSNCYAPAYFFNATCYPVVDLCTKDMCTFRYRTSASASYQYVIRECDKPPTGTNIYNYGRRVFKQQQVFYTATDYGWTENSTEFKGLINANLTGYLKEGMNTITTRTIVGGKGETYIEFIIRTLYDEWDDGCSSLGHIVQGN